mgnify:FL=1
MWAAFHGVDCIPSCIPHISCRLSRLSILFSVIRIDPSKTRRFVLLIGGIIFVFVCGFLIAQLYWTCEPEKEWKTWRVPQCELSEQVAITQLICAPTFYSNSVDIGTHSRRQLTQSLTYSSLLSHCSFFTFCRIAGFVHG